MPFHKCEYFFCCCLTFFSVRMVVGGDGGRFAAGMSVDICDHISRFHRNTTHSHTHTHIPLSRMEYVGARATATARVDVSGSLELMKKSIISTFYPCRSRFFLSLASPATLPFIHIQHTTSLQNIRLKHALNISTRNLRQSTHWNLTASLCGFRSVTTGEMEREKKFVVDIELTIKQ